MRKHALGLFVTFALAAFAARAADVEVPTTKARVTGQWISNFCTATNYATEIETPLVMVWSGEDCHYCNDLKTTFLTQEFKAWQAASGYVFCLVEGTKWGRDKGENAGSGAVQFASDKRYGTVSGFPYVALYLDSRSEMIHKNFTGRLGTMPVNVTTGTDAVRLRESFCQSADTVFEGWDDIEVGEFKPSGTEGDRLECEPATTYVDVPLVRTGKGLGAASAQLVVGDAAPKATYDFLWAEGQSETTVRIAAVAKTCAMVLKDAEGDVADTNTIFYVADRENNPKNPYWFGERDAQTLKPGEWTMDRDLALAKAGVAGGTALTVVGGSLWCPDCVNADAYLVDLPVFKDWAAKGGVYCAAIDVPKFPDNGTTCLMTYVPTSVSDRYVYATEPPQARIQSGAGYLSRKMVPQAGNGGTNATAILARNLYLATNDVTTGGLCRPECMDPANTETGKWKTGLPCFILQNAKGEIKGRLYQFNNVSPTDATAASAYVRRLEELRQLADDPTEELNRHWSTATTKECEISFGRGEAAASTGTVASTVSAVDTSDFWKISGLDAWSKVSFRVGGAGGGQGLTALPSAGAAGEVNARLVLWRKEGDSAVRVSAAAGNLATGFALEDREVESAVGVEYFIQLETLSDSDAFKLEHEGDSVVSYTLEASAVPDPGVVVFTKSAATVTEADAKKAGGTLRVYAPLARTGGASGELTVQVAIDPTWTTAFEDRYEIVNDTVVWADGETGVKSVAIDVFDDGNADGTQQLVLTVGESSFTLTIVDNDKANAGKLSFADAEPAPAKKGTVIAEEGSLVTLEVERIDGASGDVGCTVKTTAGEFEGETELSWRSREAGAKQVKLRLPALAECKAAKAVVSFASLDGIKVDASTKSMTVQMVAAGAPRFETDEAFLNLVRYCEVSREIAVLNLAEGATAKVTKLSGSVPSGVTVKLVDDVLQISGMPTKEGAFEAVYQVSQTVNRKTTPGLTVRLAFTVTDVTTLDPSAPGANQSVAKSRTFGDQTVVDAKVRRLTGVLSNLTVPPTGRCSAKYKCSEGTVSLSAKGWSGHDAETGELTATLTVSRKDYVLTVRARADGAVLYSLEDPAFEQGALAGTVAPGWSADDPATDWLGYYVAAVDAPIAELVTGEPLAAGNPYLTLKMQSASLAKKGTMSYAGVLPNGQAFSGSATLVRDGLETAILPVYYRSAKEFFTLAPQIKAGAPAKAVESGETILPWWTHTETVADGCYEICYSRIAGSHYDATADLLDTLRADAKGHDLVAADAIDPIPVTFTSKALALDKTAAKESSAKLSFAKSTGIVSGSFRTLNAAGKTVSATFKGVALLDWGDGCPSCGDVPWASGAFWYADTLPYEQAGRVKSLSVKCGDVLYVESY